VVVRWEVVRVLRRVGEKVKSRLRVMLAEMVRGFLMRMVGRFVLSA